MTVKKKIQIFERFLYIINSIIAFTLLLSYILPYISPKKFPLFAVFSLLVPFLIINNSIFTIYWIIKLKKNWIISAVVLLIGYLISTPFFKVTEKKNYLDNDIKVMSYNVRMLNAYKHINEKNIDTKIINFISQKNPDILAVQEFYSPYLNKINFKYSYFEPKMKNKKFGLALFSNYKIIRKGSLDFKDTNNNTIFIDIVKEKDTIRIYNIHLQSLKINPKAVNFGQKNSEVLIKRLENGFSKQADQTTKIILHQEKFKGKTIVCGDLNNTAYSWVYNQLSKHKKDAFIMAGTGFGRTFNYFFPMRIDFILIDESFKVNRFQTFDKNYSDHYPILTRVNY